MPLKRLFSARPQAVDHALLESFFFDRINRKNELNAGPTVGLESRQNDTHGPW